MCNLSLYRPYTFWAWTVTPFSIYKITLIKPNHVACWLLRKSKNTSVSPRENMRKKQKISQDWDSTIIFSNNDPYCTSVLPGRGTPHMCHPFRFFCFPLVKEHKQSFRSLLLVFLFLLFIAIWTSCNWSEKPFYTKKLLQCKETIQF